MPTAFCAEWKNGSGPTVATYAEYDAVPGQCQASVPFKKPRKGLSEYASGHTDPHSALGISTLGGILATKAVMEKYNIPGKLFFTGEPAEKLRGSKPIHAANGYYDNIDDKEAQDIFQADHILLKPFEEEELIKLLKIN